MMPIDPQIDGLQSVVYAKDQPEYIPLPTSRDNDGTVVTCWKFDWRERLRILFGTPLYLTVLTFNHALQPLRPSLDKPEAERSNQ
jgi:hypothetical protein